MTKIKILDSRAVIPSRAHETDTGYDVRLIDIFKIMGDVIFFKTGFAIQPPEGHYYEMVPRSSISKLPLQLANQIGIIDEHYRGEIIVALRILHSEQGGGHEFTSFPNGLVKIFGRRPNTMQAVAQLILDQQPVLTQLILRKRLDSELVVVEELGETERGEGGFGSTNVMVVNKSVAIGATENTTSSLKTLDL